tara:strand:+ start:3866 stop:4168 length:303 start_codon:yes stop_codon:yes gene_type:complete
MIVSVLLGISICFNLCVSWYIFRLLRNLVDVTEEFENFKTKLLIFSDHVESISQMESFYGDQTITSLINHMKVIKEDIKNYSKILVLHDDEEETINAPEN